MVKTSYEDLVCEYIKCAELVSDIDYGNKSAVRRSNKAVDKMIRISKCINDKYQSRIYDFAKLLENKNFDIDGWVAHHILENMNYPPELENKALEIIIEHSKRESIDGLGERMWLEQWYKGKNK